MDRAELIDDPRFRTNALRWQNTREFEDIIHEWTTRRTAADCERILLAAGVPASRYYSVAEQLDNEHMRERGTFVRVEDSAGQYNIVGSPIHFGVPEDAYPSPLDGATTKVPGFGSDTELVLSAILGQEKARELLLDQPQAAGSAGTVQRHV
jgi:crotonobetainyl-CoA:carnitine CoA-transferase CaiB-like acyl-CoA transferase